MTTALVLSAGGMYAAWEVGVWIALRRQFTFDIVAGTSAGAWNAWAIAGGCTPEDLVQEWLHPDTSRIMQFGLHPTGILSPTVLHQKARSLYERFRPRIPFALTLTEVPRMRPLLVRGPDVTWRHLAATCSIPLAFPPVEIDGRYYLDGGFLGSLPIWVAEELGATRAVTANVLNQFPFRVLRAIVRPRRESSAVRVFPIEPSLSLGPLRDGVVWSASNVQRWIELGETDGTNAAKSITM